VRSLAPWILAVALVAPVTARAQLDPAPLQQSAAGKENAPSLEREARQIETMLVAPCCWREQVSTHQSEAAEQVKREIRQMLAAGMVRQQVLDGFVARYGARILVEPPDQGFGRVLYQAPWIVGLASAAGVVLVIRHITRRRRTNDAVEADGDQSRAAAGTEAQVRPPADDEYSERLDEELRNLD
jgi:cytochrome c-type biogenesis protein CcmH